MSRWKSPDRKRAAQIARAVMWAAKGRARVIHPKYGEIIVPCASPFAATLCAAEVWKCDWMEIRDAQVLRVDQ